MAAIGQINFRRDIEPRENSSKVEKVLNERIGFG